MYHSIIRSEYSTFHSIWRKILFFSAMILGVFHIMIALFQYVLDFWQFAPYERWFALILFVSIVFISLFSIVFFPESRQNIKILMKKKCSYEHVFLIALFLWSATGCAILQKAEKRPYLKAADWLLFDTGISSLILFPLAGFVGKKKYRRFIELILHLAITSYSLFTFWALLQVFRNESVTLPSGNFLGLSPQMQLYLGAYYNMTGAIACMMLGLSLYMFFTQKLVWKIFYGFTFSLHLIVLFLSDSRTAFFGALFLTACSVFCYFWYLSGKYPHFSLFSRISFAFIITVVYGFFFWHLRFFITGCFESFIRFSKSSGISTYHSSAFFSVPLSSGRKSDFAVQIVREISPDLNGRTDIWIAAFRVIISSPLTFLIGVSPVGLTDALISIGGITEQFYSTHNIFLDVAVKFGVPTMIAFLVFTARIIIHCFQVLLRFKNEDFKKVFMIPITIFTLYLLNLTEGYLIAYFCIQSCVFFLFCGWITVLDSP